MKARPILFSGPMVRALLEGRKTQTRRIVKGVALDWLHADFDPALVAAPENDVCPYGKPADLLWVRERVWQTCRLVNDSHPESGCSDVRPVWFDRVACPADGGDCLVDMAIRPSIHMPRWASRLTLELTEVRVQRLQDISEEDAVAEGCIAGWLNDGFGPRDLGDGTTIESPGTWASAAGKYQILWDSINGDGSWDIDPWVWALTFRVHQQNIDELLKRRGAA